MTRKRLLSEPEAWREVARQIAESDAAELHFFLPKLEALRDSGAMSSAAYRRADDRFWTHKVGDLPLVGADAQSERVLACLFLALEAEDELHSVRDRAAKAET